jgi:NADPH:quinone reductase-like Zn-dependent oxidoreductase
MRGALISTLSSPPEVTELDEPQAGSGEILVSIQAVALNPLDVNVGSGRVYLFGDGRGVTAPGFMAERVALPSELPLALPDGVDPGLAAAARRDGGVRFAAGATAVREKRGSSVFRVSTLRHTLPTLIFFAVLVLLVAG